jgi:RNA polymerase sigma factor (sigma-70 family)
VLYKDHVEQLARYVSRRTVASEVQDVVADTFLTAWRRFDELPTDPVPWLFVTARKVMANRHRSAQRRRTLDDKLTESVLSGHHKSGTYLSDVDQQLLAAIVRLPEAEREAFMLVAWDGLDGHQASRAAGCSAATFRMRLHRARQKLKQQIGPQRPFVQLTDIQPSLEETR